MQTKAYAPRAAHAKLGWTKMCYLKKMSQPMTRSTSMRPWGRNNNGPTESSSSAPPPVPPVPNIPERAPDSANIINDYMLDQEGDRLATQWVNPHVAAFHSSRGLRPGIRVSDAPPPTPTTPSNPNGLRTMNAEQRAAYIAQRDAENAAAMGAEAHPTVAPLNVGRGAPPGKGGAQAAPRPQALDVPRTPEPNSSGQENNASSADEGPFPYRASSMLMPMSRLPTPPPTVAPPAPAPAPVTPPQSPVRTASQRLSSALMLSSPPSRRRQSLAVRPDMEIEVRGSGANRVVTIRFGSAASGATPTT